MRTRHVALALCLAGTLAACPNWNRERCETPTANANECRPVTGGRQPFMCSPSRERTPIGDEPCELGGQDCVIAPDGIAHCAPRADAGVSDGGAR